MHTVTPSVPVPPQTRRHHDPDAAKVAALLADLFGPGAPAEFAEQLGSSLARRIAAAGESLQ